MSEFDINEVTEKSKSSTSPNAEGLENATSIGERNFAQVKLDGIKQDIKERKKYALWTFVFLCVFTSTVVGIIILSGFSKFLNFELSDTVLIALITTSLSAIVGIFILVMRYLFK